MAYGSRFGNTQRVAQALARGLGRNRGVTVDCLSIDEVPIENLRRYDLLAVGGPTEVLSASRQMKAFLAKLPNSVLQGKFGFAFDTKLGSRMAGSAGRYIEKHLEQLGVDIVRGHASAIVRGMTKEEREKNGTIGAPEWSRKLDKSMDHQAIPNSVRRDLLSTGAEIEFERIGAEIGAILALPAASG